MTTAETRTDRDVVELLLEQHDEIKSMFNELRQVQGPAKQELFNDLVRLLAVHETAEETVVHPVSAEVTQHATKEEGEEFLRLRATVDADKLRKMAGALKAAEAAAPTRPHAGAPESAAGNILVGPPVAVFDRIRDAIRDWRQKNPDND